MVDKFTDDQIEEYKRVFNLLDKDGSGKISSSELSYGLRQLGVTMNSEEVNELVAETDLNKDGEIDFTEFITLISKSNKDLDVEEELREIFMIFDRENKGVITPAQIKYVMRCLQENFTDDEIDELITEGDRDGDGKLSFEEFSLIMNAKDPQNK
jgi:calmodulin